MFQTYLIEVLGVEYSTNEVVQSVQEKINNLFKKTHHINDLKFDTYLFYYSGLTLQDGSLVFSGLNYVDYFFRNDLFFTFFFYYLKFLINLSTYIKIYYDNLKK